MAEYRISTPDGAVYNITAPDSASQADVMARVKAQHQNDPAPPKPAASKPSTPTPQSGYDKARGRMRKDASLPGWEQPFHEFNRQATMGGSEALEAGVLAARTGIDKLRGKDPGYSMGDTYKAARDVMSEETKKRSSGVNTAAGVAGGVGGLLAAGAGAAGAKGLSALERVGQGAKAGAGYGAAAGAFGAHDPKRAPGEAVEGAAGGAVLGAAMEPAMMVLKMGAKAANALSGNNFVSGMRRAEQMLWDAFRKDGVDRTQTAAKIAQWKRDGVSPSLLDVGGKHVQQLVKKAGAKEGKAQSTLDARAQAVSENLAKSAIDRTKQLVREKRPASEVRKALVDVRKKVAEQKYPREQQHPIPVDQTILSAVSEREGREAIFNAAKDARIQRQSARASELEKLAKLSEILEHDGPKAVDKFMAQHPQSISAGALDAIQSTMQDLAKGSMSREVSTRATRGFTERSKDIAHVLDSVPELQDARRTYKMHSDMIAGFDKGADFLKEKDGAQLAKDFAAMNKGAKQTARIGAKQALEEALGGNAVETLKKVQSSENMKSALTTLFGADEAARYSRAAKFRLEQLSRAQKATRGAPSAEGGLHTGLAHTPTGMAASAVKGAVSKASRTMSQKEADAIASLSSAPAKSAYRRVEKGESKQTNIRGRKRIARGAAQVYAQRDDQ